MPLLTQESRWFPRVVARGFWGIVSPPPFSYDLTSHQYFTAAKKSGGLKNLTRLRGFEELQEEAELDSGAALALDSRLIVPSVATTWTDATGGSAMSYVEEVPNLFGGNKPGHAYYNDGVPVRLSGFPVEENQPFTVRAFVFEPKELSEAEKDALEDAGLDPHHIWFVEFDRWLFRIVDGTFFIARKSGSWTQTKQSELDALLDIAEPTEAQQDEIDELQGPRRVEAGGVSYPDAIYDVHETLSLGKPLEKQEGKYYEILFHPEPRGRLNIHLAGGKPQSVEVPEIIASRDVGQVYASTSLVTGSNGQTFLWQPGYAAFKPKGTLRIGPFKTGYWTDSMGTALLSAIKDDSLPGTNITIQHIVHNSVWFSFLITVTTSNPRYSPFLYGAQANLTAGARSGSDEVSWDSSEEENRVLGGHPAIEDMTPRCESGSPVMPRQEWQVTVRDPSGRALASLSDDNNCDALENRVMDLSVGDSLDNQIPVVTTGLVTSSQINDARHVRFSLSGVIQALRARLFQEKTQINLTVADGCAILDEDLMSESPIGDGMRLGAFLRLLLKNGGWSNAEVSGVSALDGRGLPRAALGERPCVRPDRGASRGEYIRSLLEKYGRGWRLYINANGVWQFAPRPTGVKLIEGQEAHFSSDHTANNKYSYPGRFAVLDKLDHIRDTGDFYNYFRVEGWVDPATGQRISDEHVIAESWKKTSIWASLKFIGRLKRYPTVRDDGLRTPGDVREVLDNLVRLYGRSCRFVQFTSYFHIGLMPGDRITVDGIPCEVVRIASGSLDKDRMQIVAMELV